MQKICHFRVNHFQCSGLEKAVIYAKKRLKSISLRRRRRRLRLKSDIRRPRANEALDSPICLAPKVRETSGNRRERGVRLDRHRPRQERREWPRLPLAIPVFVRSRDQGGKDFLEFATALNVSAGGALVAVHRSLKPAAQVSLEIPSAPLAASAPVRRHSRNLRGKIVRVTHAEGYHLLALKFARPLVNAAAPPGASRRKVSSSV